MIVAVDVDGTLTKSGDAWTPEDCLDCRPNQAMIERVNSLAQTNFIVILTARRDFLIPATLKWLRMHGVIFHAISNNKMPADLYIDDKAQNIDDFLIDDDLPQEIYEPIDEVISDDIAVELDNEIVVDESHDFVYWWLREAFK